MPLVRILAGGVNEPLGVPGNIPEDKANAIADCLENQFTPHDLCDENHEQVEAEEGESKLCSKLQIKTPHRGLDHVTYKN
jgi:hypothetical protein